MDYACIGDGRSAALISRTGSVDWLCWPRFDSPSLFGKILDPQIGGFWKIAPRSFDRIERAYIEDTNVLQTYFFASSNVLCLTDFMTALSEEEKQKTIQPEHELIRLISCEEGEIAVEIQFNPRPEYGSKSPVLKDLGSLGIRLEFGQHLITLRSEVTFTLGVTGASAEIKIKKGDQLAFFLLYARDGPGILPPFSEADSKLRQTIQWWKTWSLQCHYQGTYRKEIIRSALALKLLSFAPSGAFIAAPTTSLPEKIGGNLNWDYRFCWLRDAAFTVQALLSLGFQEDAQAFVSWLLHSTRLTLPRLNILYTVYGNQPQKEKYLNHLQGYSNSTPVRIGNAASEQRQLDCYGEVIDAVYAFVQQGGRLDRETKKMLRLFGNYVCKHWQEPDQGIWEDRGEPQHYTHSKLMCWVALDRLIAMNEKPWVKRSELNLFIKTREEICHALVEKGWNSHLESYVSVFKGNTIDVSLLLMSLCDFEKADSPRMKKTYLKIKQTLSNGELVYRAEKSLKDQEGSFLICCFWVVEFLAKSGFLTEAKENFSRLLSYANDVGLFSEELDPKTHEALGNFPQAFTHIALIKSALTLEKETYELE